MTFAPRVFKTMAGASKLGAQITVGIYMPRWLRFADASNARFYKEFTNTLTRAGVKVLSVPLPHLLLQSAEDAHAYVKRNSLQLIVQHDSYFYRNREAYKRNVSLLEAIIPLMSSSVCHERAYDKVIAAEVLHRAGVPVMRGVLVHTSKELREAMTGGVWFVLKPRNKGSGEGVALVRLENDAVLMHKKGAWTPVEVKDERDGVRISSGLLSSYWYADVLVEPYHNDDSEGFASLRATVIGGKVIEAVRRINKKAITSNISNGGTAVSTSLTPEQERIACAAADAVGADYAGVDLLYAKGKTLVGEVNIGPITLYDTYTGANTGEALAKHVLSRL